VNIMFLNDFKMFKPFAESYSNIANQNVVPDVMFLNESISGIATIINIVNLPIFLLLSLVFFVIWLRALKVLEPILNIRYLSIIMLTGLVCSAFGGPFISTIWFLFFMSIVLMPFTFQYLSERFRKSVTDQPQSFLKLVDHC
jgi:hypothetical protein